MCGSFLSKFSTSEIAPICLKRTLSRTNLMKGRTSSGLLEPQEIASNKELEEVVDRFEARSSTPTVTNSSGTLFSAKKSAAQSEPNSNSTSAESSRLNDTDDHSAKATSTGAGEQWRPDEGEKYEHPPDSVSLAKEKGNESQRNRIDDGSAAFEAEMETDEYYYANDSVLMSWGGDD